MKKFKIKFLLNYILYLKNRGVKIFTGLGKSIYKFLSGSEFQELLSDTNTSSSDLIDFSKILLCIDDIDRKSPTLNSKEFFGFVNNLVENQNAKILLIANEKEFITAIRNFYQNDQYQFGHLLNRL
ncbi:P-loop NTPase fold protein [Flavobacterium sp.]|uniref:P-loop NTPase fold protein n=1 Tax=Flavobacterium sp. TaxID=239 RepID=UPI003C6FFB7F